MVNPKKGPSIGNNLETDHSGGGFVMTAVWPYYGIMGGGVNRYGRKQPEVMN